jgi:hypothetical protein
VDFTCFYDSRHTCSHFPNNVNLLFNILGSSILKPFGCEIINYGPKK